MNIRMHFLLSTLLIAPVISYSANAQDCFQSSILSPAPFMGNNTNICMNTTHQY